MGVTNLIHMEGAERLFSTFELENLFQVNDE